MQTVNISINPDTWVQVADSVQGFTLSGAARMFVDIALTNADASPAANLSGHSLVVGPGNEALTRGALGVGFVWAKLNRASVAPGAFVVVTK